MKTRRYIMLLLTLVLAITFTGCGKAKEVKDIVKKLSAGEAVLSSVTKMKKANSLRADIEIDMEMSLLGQNMETEADIRMLCFDKPRKLHNEIKVDMGLLGEQSYEVYAQEKEDVYDVYLKNGSGWDVKTVQKADKQYDIIEALDFYLNNVEELSETGTEELSGRKTKSYEGIIRGEAVLNIMKDLKVSDMIKEAAGNNFEIEDSMLENLGEIPVTLWIDTKTGYLLQCDMDMTGAAKTLLINVISQLDSIAGTLAKSMNMEVNNLEFSMECSDFNEVLEFSMPKQAGENN